MRTIAGTPHSWSCQSVNNCISATESPPPETASAAREAGVTPSRSSATENRAARFGFESTAFVVGALGPRARRDGRCGVGIFCGERDKCGTAFFHLTKFEQRQPELQHAFGRTLGLGIFLQQFGEIARRLGVVLL